MNENGFAHIVLLILVVGTLILFSPIPTYNSGANCLLIDDCPKGITWSKSLYQRLFSQPEIVVDDFDKVRREAEKELQEKTIDWETYIDDELSISFKYPSDWEIDSSQNHISLVPPYSSESNLYDGAVYIEFEYKHAIENITSIDEFKTAYELFLEEQAVFEYESSGIMVLGNNRYWIARGGCCMEGGIHAYLLHNETITRIRLSNLNGEITDSEINTFNQILSTYQFIDNKPHYPFEGRFNVYRIDTVNDEYILTTHLELTSVEGEMDEACLWTDESSQNKKCFEFDKLLSIPVEADSDYIYAEVTDIQGNNQLFRDSIFGGAPGYIAE